MKCRKTQEQHIRASATVVCYGKVDHSGEGSEVNGVFVKSIGLEDEGNDPWLEREAFHVFRWSIGGRGYRFAPMLEIHGSVEHDVREEMGKTPNRPAFAHKRVGLEVVIVRRVVYNVVEELLGEPR